MKRLILVPVLALALGGCLAGGQVEGKTAEEWQAEFSRMETKHNLLREDYQRFRDCVGIIEPGFFKSDNAVIEEIKVCSDTNPL